MSPPAPKDRQYDVIIWGVTSFTGKIVAHYLVTAYGLSGTKLRYAFGGRSQSKINTVLEDVARINPDARATPVVLGDSTDKESMVTLAQQSICICSLVGPYDAHGEPLVAACADNGTHYVDLTAEFGFMRRMIFKYNDIAVKNKAKIVHSCGFDSIPSDMGCYMMQQYAREHFNNEPLEFIRIAVKDVYGGFSGGTVASLAGMYDCPKEQQRRFSRVDYLTNVKSVDGIDLPPKDDAMLAGAPLVWDEDLNIYTAPFLMAPCNTKVVSRTAELLSSDPAKSYGDNFEYNECTAAGNKVSGYAQKLATRAAEFATTFSYFRSFLKWMVPQGSGPSEKVRAKGYFHLVGVGRTKKGEDGTAKKVFAKIGSTCGDPGYQETAKMLAESALCAALDSAKTPQLYGVLTPATAFDGALLDRLRSAKMYFEVQDHPFDK